MSCRLPLQIFSEIVNTSCKTGSRSCRLALENGVLQGFVVIAQQGEGW